MCLHRDRDGAAPPVLLPGALALAMNLELSGELKQLPLALQWKPLFLPALRLFNLFCFECCMGVSGEGFGGSFLGPHLMVYKV